MMRIFVLLISLLINSNQAISSYEDCIHESEPFRITQGIIRYDEDLIRATFASRSLARFALNHSSEELISVVKDLFSGFGRLILRFDLKPDDLKFILESVPEARSSFSLKYEPVEEVRSGQVEAAYGMLINASFRRFPVDFLVNFADYASDIDTWMTAISYRMIGPTWIKNSYKKSSSMSRFLQEGSLYLIPGISREFPNRGSDARISQSQEVVECPGINQEPYRDYPVLPGMPGRYFKSNSYVAESLNAGIPMRAHVSGSAPLTLSAMKFILEKGMNSFEMNSEPVQILLNGLIIALFDCGDYHSISESSAGVSYYYQSAFSQVDFHPFGAKYLESVSGRNWLALGIGYLSRIVAENSLDEFLLLSQDLLEQLPG